MEFDTLIYGKQEIENELVKSIINNPAMQRLKGINQYGFYDLTKPIYPTSRFDHSLGVFLLLRSLGAPLKEQIAGLLRDVSHTTFSHVIDYLFKDEVGQEYHEGFMKKIIFESGIAKLLGQNGIDVNSVLDEKNFPLLERDRPELCADRVDYFMRDYVVTLGKDVEIVKRIRDSLTVVDNDIVVTNKSAALSLGLGFMENCSNFWGCFWQSGCFHTFAKALKEGINTNVISHDDFFGVDSSVLSKLAESGNDNIICLLKLARRENFVEGTPDDHDISSKTKARYVDPKFIQDGKIVRLSEVDDDFKVKLKEFINKYSKPFYIKIVK